METGAKHALIIRRKLEEKTEEEIAAEVGLTTRQVRGVWAQWRDSEKELMVQEDPLDVVFEHVIGFKDLRSKANKVFDESAGTIVTTEGGGQIYVGANPNVRLGALKLLMDLRVKEIGLRQSTGLLPHDLGQVSINVDVRYWTEQMIAVLVKHDVPTEVAEEMLAILDGGARPEQPDDDDEGDEPKQVEAA